MLAMMFIVEWLMNSNVVGILNAMIKSCLIC